MSFSDIIIPRPEVLRKDGIEGVIDIQNLLEKKKSFIESRPEDFFDITYPTTDVNIVLDSLHRRFNSPEKSPGLFLFEGFKGSGKSHLELLVYHLFTNASAASHWLTQHELKCALPQDAIVVIHKFTDFPLDSIWGLVFERLGVDRNVDQNKLPNLDELRSALQGKRLVLILDELEMGIQSIANDHIRSQNLSFLQMLSEEGLRSDTASITILASVYDANREPGSTLKRVPRVDIKFTEPLDRQKVVLHRLFSNAHSLDRSKVESVVRSYVNNWKKAGVTLDEKYIEMFVRSYPFSPELLDMLLHRVLRRDFQGNRGPLGLLGSVVRNTYKKVDIITAGHMDITDNGIRNRLLDLDPGQSLLQCAQSDLRIVESRSHSSEIVSAVLFATLTGSGNVRGISQRELITQVLKPGDDQNEYQITLQALERFGSYFQQAEGNFLFDTQEKPYAKVEYHALRVDPGEAREFALNRWRTNVFGDSNAVVLRDPAQARNALSQLDKTNLRFVLSSRRLNEEDRLQIYHGTENRNQILLLEPKSDAFNALDHADLVKWAQLAKAANELSGSTAELERKRQYEKIGSDNIKYIDDAFKKAGLYYVSLHSVHSDTAPLQTELESLGSATSRPDVLTHLQQQYFPPQRFEDHIQECLADDRRKLLIDKNCGEIKATYKKTLGFPVFITETIFIQALTRLCKDRHIGLKSNRIKHCGSTPSFSGSDWNDVILVEPFVEESEPNQLPFGEPQQVSVSTPASATGSDIEEIFVPSIDEEVIAIQTPNEPSINQLRQRVAERLGEFNDPKIIKAKMIIYFQNATIELSTLPSTIRGALTGLGNIHCEIEIEKLGQFNKAQIEQLVEQLPSFSGAFYRADLRGSSLKQTNSNGKK